VIKIWIGVVIVAMCGLAAAEPSPRVVAVVNRAEWCSVCKAHGPRAAKVLVEDGALAVIVNDLTDEASATKSQPALRAAGLDRAMTAYTAAGVVYLFDAKTKRSLGQVTVANTDREIKMVVEMAKKQAAP
jgi:hypothetical protein